MRSNQYSPIARITLDGNKLGTKAIIRSVSYRCPGTYPHTYNGVNCAPCLGLAEHPAVKRPTFFASIIEKLRKLGGL